MVHKQKKDKTTQNDKTKTYIPNNNKKTEEHDLFIDLLSYERRNSFSKSDIWNYQYV